MSSPLSTPLPSQPAEKQWEEMNDEKKAQYSLQFKRHEGDIGCVSHIYNLGVVAGRHITKRSILNYTYIYRS